MRDDLGVVPNETTMDIVDVQGSDETAPAPEKKPRRKRGQRGGKNNKKKVGFIEPTTDVDDDDQGDENGDIGRSSNVIPKDVSPLDQGFHQIEDLTITDKLLGNILLRLV